LQDERASEAIQNRNQATLDEVRAMKELDQMDLNSIEKSLRITEMLTERNRLEEEETKADDIALADMSAQIPLGNPQPMGGENENV
jgi:hypothetical protein